ncbi:hypothetical protein SESBI_41872 [Sesbania bispinosa]|nr:hypothetical protein SESBI_41872 [Sesbania bispinosa]
MARKLSISMFCMVAMLLFLESHAETGVTTTEAPAPQPSNNTTNLPTHGTTEGSLQPADAQIHNTRNHACSSAISVVPNACVYLLELMETSRSAHAITIGRPKGEDPNAPEG